MFSHQQFAFLCVNGMPCGFRMTVEETMVKTLKSEPCAVSTSTDFLDIASCTKWERSTVRGRVDCRQLLSGTEDELAQFGRELDALAQTHGFSASLELVG
ncbi:hypothetical protein P4N68_08920 [Corynebacterium felinum]|uniref:Uncharacterized protein n=1 Tax=Corynebacterium felinum TaxID=131318 RepID=A0ABU2BD55_9CORY|nr:MULTISPECIES: hypothetical protein [Corynebacterium]MDF5821196.1 hypothetical protein [Corynebacterium felinum]MDO4760929.1 hypothetical protein [Corynebacterium sp.]MDR7356286.1 hypothetical protein [Corynebacterium felinum]WJY95619.1 hypothetical protein CFELI_10095 [Corynebacterium felinum]